MKNLIAPLLFGSTLGPVVGQIAFGFDLGWWGLALGIAVGIFSGILLAALMRHIYTFHMGYNLYNTGTTGGFVATVIYMFLRGFGLEIKSAFYWSTEYTPFLTVMAIICLGTDHRAGVFMGRQSGGVSQDLAQQRASDSRFCGDL